MGLSWLLKTTSALFVTRCSGLRLSWGLSWMPTPKIQCRGWGDLPPDLPPPTGDKRRACGGELRRKNGPHILHSTSEWAALLRDSLIIGLSWLPWISECHRGSDMSWPYAFIRMLVA